VCPSVFGTVVAGLTSMYHTATISAKCLPVFPSALWSSASRFAWHEADACAPRTIARHESGKTRGSRSTDRTTPASGGPVSGGLRGERILDSLSAPSSSPRRLDSQCSLRGGWRGEAALVGGLVGGTAAGRFCRNVTAGTIGVRCSCPHGEFRVSFHPKDREPVSGRPSVRRSAVDGIRREFRESAPGGRELARDLTSSSAARPSGCSLVCAEAPSIGTSRGRVNFDSPPCRSRD